LIHRDIKPNNMIACSRQGNCDHLKLFDFGLVRDLERNPGESVTQEDLVVGTPAYMSPEQVTRAQTLDPRSDIYSLGAVAYFLLTGAAPFQRNTSVEVLMAHLNDPVVRSSERRPGIGSDLEEVVLRCLEKDSAKRFQSAEAFLERLSGCADSSLWTAQNAVQWWQTNGPGHHPEQCGSTGPTVSLASESVRQ
jgi:serine/threonine-protein kinase